MWTIYSPNPGLHALLAATRNIPLFKTIYITGENIQITTVIMSMQAIYSLKTVTPHTLVKASAFSHSARFIAALQASHYKTQTHVKNTQALVLFANLKLSFQQPKCTLCKSANAPRFLLRVTG